MFNCILLVPEDGFMSVFFSVIFILWPLNFSQFDPELSVYVFCISVWLSSQPPKTKPMPVDELVTLNYPKE